MEQSIFILSPVEINILYIDVTDSRALVGNYLQNQVE